MKVLYYTFGVCFILFIVYGCNKGIAATYSLDSLDRSRFEILEGEIKSIENIAGVYTGNICDNSQGKINKVKMVLLEDSTFDLFCESTNGNKKFERIRGSYAYSSDTLTLFTATHNKYFLIKNEGLNFICDTLFSIIEIEDTNMLLKN